MATATVAIPTTAVNTKRDPNIGRARRAAYKHGMKMLKRKDGTYKLVRLIPPKYNTATVLEGLSPECILELCFWLDALVRAYGNSDRVVEMHFPDCSFMKSKSWELEQELEEEESRRLFSLHQTGASQ